MASYHRAMHAAFRWYDDIYDAILPEDAAHTPRWRRC